MKTDCRKAYAVGKLIDIPKDITVFDLIRKHFKERPDSIAVIHGKKSISYNELNKLSGLLASELLRNGVDTEQLVPIISNGGINYIIGIMSILRCGAAFVPIDTSWPEKRIKTILTDMKPRVVIRDDQSQEKSVVPELSRCHWIDVGSVLSSNSVLPFDDITVSQNDLIYGFYTSGSTGNPKCCLNIHKGLLNRILHMSRVFPSSPEDGVLQNSRHTFDSSLWQIFWPLSFGGTVIIPQRNDGIDFAKTLDTIKKHMVTATDFVPSIFNLLVQYLIANPENIKALSSFKYLLIGGEEINSKWIKRFHQLCPHIEIVNTYGPTEASIGMVFNRIKQMETKSIITLGKPISNTHAVILNDHKQVCRIGEIGEIAIGGLCLGRGYLNLTKNNMCINPVSELKGENLYLTGDMGYIDEKGLLYFKGRKDHQVKIKGERIEIDEIKSCLLELKEVSEVGIVDIIDINDDKQIIAFTAGDDLPDIQEIKRRLGKTLPASHIPDQILKIKTFPKTHNGKIDRNALLRLYYEKFSNPIPRQSYEIQSIVDAFQTIVGRKIQPDENLSELGVNSLSVFRLILLLEKKYRISVTPAQIYKNPSPQKLATYLSDPEKNIKEIDDYIETKRDIQKIVSRFNALETQLIYEKNKPVAFLTGSTGFLGSHLLYDFLKRKFKVLCLVRARNENEAYQRILSSLKNNNLILPEESMRRVTAIPGDLALPDLGLEPSQLRSLTTDADTVVHCGAKIDFLETYSGLKEVNVSSTCALLDALIENNPNVIFNYISTTSSLNNNQSQTPDETTLPTPELIQHDGYGKSKAMAELATFMAGKCGLRYRIFRIGEILPAVRTGGFNPQSLFTYLIQSIVHLKLCPSIHLNIDYTTVDILSNFIAQISIEDPAEISVVHSFNNFQISLQTIIESFEKILGPVERVGSKEFLYEVTSLSQNEGAPPFITLLSLFFPYIENETQNMTDRKLKTAFKSASQQIGKTEKTFKLETTHSLNWPFPSHETLKPFVDNICQQTPEMEFVN